MLFIVSDDDDIRQEEGPGEEGDSEDSFQDFGSPEDLDDIFADIPDDEGGSPAQTPEDVGRQEDDLFGPEEDDEDALDLTDVVEDFQAEGGQEADAGEEMAQEPEEPEGGEEDEEDEPEEEGLGFDLDDVDTDAVTDAASQEDEDWGEEAGEDEEGGPTLDTGAVKAQLKSAKAQKKVDLDLEDAPFLEDEEEEELPAAAVLKEEPEVGTAIEQARELPAWLKSKKLMIPLSLLLLLLLLIPAKMIFFPGVELFPKEKASLQETGDLKESELEPKKIEKQEITIRFKPFWVEKQTEDGKVRFLQCKFSFTTLNPQMELEVKHKDIIIRDAIYYYLRNKELEFLVDSKNLSALKTDLLTVMNQYLGSDQIDNLLIEEYLVR
jgi:flagellar FliL protein